jgi:hypothetical protein
MRKTFALLCCFCDYFVAKLLEIWKWISSCFSFSSRSATSISSNGSSHLQSIINAGECFVTRHLREENTHIIADPSCKMAIVAKLNQQIVSQHLTVIIVEHLSASRQLAIQKLTHDLMQHAQRHQIQDGDQLSVETYFSKRGVNNCYNIDRHFDTQSPGRNSSDRCPGLSLHQATQYLSVKYDAVNNSVYKQHFLKFMLFTP